MELCTENLYLNLSNPNNINVGRRAFHMKRCYEKILSLPCTEHNRNVVLVVAWIPDRLTQQLEEQASCNSNRDLKLYG